MPAPQFIDQLERYFNLLRRWNARINVTGLPLEPPVDETFDRLFLEPLAAATQVPDEPLSWFDLGSGGGSPAIPLKVVRPALRLTMVESKTRKAAFLREVVRVLNVADARVENARIEAVADRSAGAAELITLRAIRVQPGLVEAATRMLSLDGKLILFTTRDKDSAAELAGLIELATVRLPRSAIVTYAPLFY
jgi:16S rRNA (guanine527-N7)-methyltransferase